MFAVIFSPWTFISYPNKVQDTNCLTGMALPATHSANHVHVAMKVQHPVVDGLAYVVCMNYTVIEFQVHMCWNVWNANIIVFLSPRYWLARSYGGNCENNIYECEKTNIWKTKELLNNWVVWKPQAELAPPLSAIWTNTSICSCGDATLAFLHLNSFAKGVL